MLTPIFSGVWHSTQGIHFLDLDACGDYVFSYDEKAVGTAEQAANELLRGPNESDCVWNEAQFLEKNESMPEDYPADLRAWDQAKNDPHNPLIQTWKRSCLDKYGNVQNSKKITLSPMYVCPAGSRIGVYAHNKECTTTPDTCDADIVGRSLKYPGISWTGHVGLTVSGWNVLEVLNDATVIHVFDSFDEFKTQPIEYPYWGDVYMLPGMPSLTDKQALNILSMGVKQADYDPEYTFSALWQVG
ncbi:MAG: hypothetical protein EBX40_01850, partial [Gammaproteobacteria bacterium]|nr:hypothetical protein [Gammaproteobacteria bacterium]